MTSSQTPKVATQKSTVAVLVLNYNGRRHLPECFSSLSKQAYRNLEVYLVDNGSVDDSVEYTKTNFPWVKTLEFKENLGFAKAYNQAVKSVNADFVAILNNDVAVDEYWLKELTHAIEEDGEIAAVGSKLLLFNQPSIVNNAGSKISPIGAGFDIGLFEKDSPRFNVKKEVAAVSGGAMLVRKNVFLKIGGFDSDFFAYLEDVDFCWRAWLFGYKILYVPTALVYHKLGASFGNLSRFTAFLNERNRLFSIFKNFELGNLLKALIISVPYNLARAIQFDNKTASNDPFIIFNAHLYILRNMKLTLAKRYFVNQNRVVKDSALFRRNFFASISESMLEFKKFSNLNSGEASGI